MSATRAYAVMKSTAIVFGHKFGFQSGEILRQDLDLLAYKGGHYDLGGSDDVGVLSAAYVPIVGGREFTLNGDTFGGMTLDLVIWSRTRDAATSVTVRLRNLTTSADAGVTAAVTAQTPTKETLTLTLASNACIYRAELIGSNVLHPCFAFGYIRTRKVAA